jgi:hypothetical protein
MPPVMFSVFTKYHKGRHSLFLYNLEIFYAFKQDILRSPTFIWFHQPLKETPCWLLIKYRPQGSIQKIKRRKIG